MTYRVNGERLWQSLQTMAQFGAIADNGVTRLALSEEDRQARDQLRRWALEAGCSVRVDRMGNMFLRREGTRPELAPVVTGSHGDSQPAAAVSTASTACWPDWRLFAASTIGRSSPNARLK
ncbi:hypothetical protein ACF0H2_07270 [Serratia marcescens]